MDTAIAAIAGLLLLAAEAAMFARLVRHRRAAKPLDDGRMVKFAGEPPLVSILIPARNEAEVIGECVRRALAQSWPRFEVIVCDDDSTDGTGSLLQQIAQADPRLAVVPKTGPPPDGWIGKNHALHAAAQRSRGEWILAIDADCLLEPRALEAAMARALEDDGGPQKRLVSALPAVECNDFANRLMMPVFGFWLGLAAPIHRVNDPECSEALAAGGFLLLHRETWAAFGGYERLRSHIVEDVLTARLVKSSGARMALYLGRGSVRTEMYRGWSDLWEGITKNTFPAADFSVAKTVLAAAWILLVCVAPTAVAATAACLLLIGAPISAAFAVLASACAIASALLVAFHAAIHRELKIPLGAAPVAPAGHAFFAAALLVSMWRGTRGRGVAWKGRRYYGSRGGRPAERLAS